MPCQAAAQPLRPRPRYRDVPRRTGRANASQCNAARSNRSGSDSRIATQTVSASPRSTCGSSAAAGMIVRFRPGALAESGRSYFPPRHEPGSAMRARRTACGAFARPTRLRSQAWLSRKSKALEISPTRTAGATATLPPHAESTLGGTPVVGQTDSDRPSSRTYATATGDRSSAATLSGRPLARRVLACLQRATADAPPSRSSPCLRSLRCSSSTARQRVWQR